MGPQLFSCGNDAAATDIATVKLLLQWGRSFSAAEIAMKIGDQLAADLTSMGPQLFSCGNDAVHAPFVELNETSMGPQLFSCGNQRIRTRSVRSVTVLQWGRSFSAAEIKRAWSVAIIPDENFNGAAAFQLRKSFGRSRRTDPSSPDFNGAAAFQLRKFPRFEFRGQQLCGTSMGPQLFSCGNASSPAPCACPCAASMGPQLFSCGNLGGFGSRQHAIAASMGPQLFSCGNRHCLPWMKCAPRCFNGAAAFQLRKYTIMARIALADIPLQWGRSFSAAEIDTPTAAPTLANQASMGPQLFSCGNV